MDKKSLLLACLAAADGAAYEPVQIQKLIFLFQERASKLFTAKPFHFIAYDYGPFDKDIYSGLESLEAQGLVEIYGSPFSRPRLYGLSDTGKAPAKVALNSIKEPYRGYLVMLSKWIRQATFAQLVGAIYKEYPSMRANSVFKE